MDKDAFRKHAHEAVDWVADYLENIEQFPVKSQVKPRDIFDQLPDVAPSNSDDFEAILDDLDKKIMPGITHWQHPNFHAYFPGNSSHPSILGEIITSGIAAQCMIWETSPAAAELEEKMMDWLKELMSLPKDWHGVIQDTASTATLAAILSAREKVTNNEINVSGFANQRLRIYCSSETHSSIDKAVRICGIGSDNLVKITVDENLAMVPSELERAISEDVENGFVPCCVVATLGTTGTLAFDPVDKIADICTKRSIWLHVDAAYAGSAFILPEYRYLCKGLEFADSYVFNPHKWLMVNFDCSAYFVKSKNELLNTFSILPEYLKTKTIGEVNNYRDWGVPLGRRFRALKLWFVLRTYGSEGLKTIIGNHMKLAEWLKKEIENHPDFELLAPQVMNMVVFRFVKVGMSNESLNKLNENLLLKINESGEAFLSHTLVSEKYSIRLVTGQTNVQLAHIQKVWRIVTGTVKSLSI
ncbi:MAG: aminotransferase class I/II-fold pyridoxal phosphate-dependent enzyme [Cyclobacteriaceae bacterium]